MAQETSAIGASHVEVVLGDLFDGGDDVIVVPCSTFGSIAPELNERLSRYPIRTPDHLDPGEVVRGWEPDGKGGPAILLAAVVVDDEQTRPDWVTAAAQRATSLATDLGRTLAFPLLGSGAGGLRPSESFAAIINGLGQNHGSVSARVYVRDKALYYELVRAMPDSDAVETVAAPDSSSSAPPSPTSKQSRVPTSEDRSPSGGPKLKNADPPGGDKKDAAGTAKREEEVVPTHTDGPAVVDELGRQGFARVLARRIRDARQEEARNNANALDPRAQRGGAFMIHLHAPWGAGKTSVLNFLSAELRKDQPAARRCVVVDFNAWRHQRIEPPWWWLMTTMYSGAVRELRRFDRWRAVKLWAHEHVWRSKSGWPGYLALLSVTTALFLGWRLGWFGSVDDRPFTGDTFKAVVVSAAAIITPALTVWGLLHAVGRWMFTTSARGAKRFVANSSDPMRLIQEHLADLTAWIHHDVVVMIDDLDRCKGPYVVELLEGIQTLFRDIPVTYVIAADRDWLADSYASEYAGFSSVAGEPGRPVGYLFLEKTFQISTGLPQAGKRIDAFWGRLLRSPTVPGEQDLEAARSTAARELGGLQADAVRREVASNPGGTPAEVQARREVVAIEMVGRRAQENHTHTLEPFRHLLGHDPNPRAMKRLVNAYGIARGIETLQGVNLEDNHLREQETALWTILTLRWPKLGAYLTRHPERLDDIGADDPAPGVPDEVRPLFTDPEVVAVVRGDAPGVDAKLRTARLHDLALN